MGDAWQSETVTANEREKYFRKYTHNNKSQGLISMENANAMTKNVVGDI